MNKTGHAAEGDAVTGPGSGRGVLRYVLPLVLAALVVAVFWQVGEHEFVNVDDNLYIYENPVVLRGLTPEGVSWAFTTFHAAYWHPVTWLSHMVDVELFGPSPGWHHRMNVLYHLLGTELLFLVLWRMTGALLPSAFVAALFAVHPLHVESVAWAAERKDVLSALFWMLTMGAYLLYVRRPGAARYALVLATFALGLMCKPMLVTLPFALLLLDFWPLGRVAPPGPEPAPSWRAAAAALPGLVREKVPLLALSAASCVVTYRSAAANAAVSSFEQLTVAARAANALVSYAVYLVKTVWPSPLAVFYPHPATVHASLPAWQVAGALVLVAAFSAFALLQARRRPYLAVGWFWYLGTLVPVIGLLQAGAQAQADRFTYVPLIGIFVAVAWGAASLATDAPGRRRAVGALAAASLAALAAAAWVQAGCWRDSVTLLSRTAAVTDRNWFALNHLGVAETGLRRYGEAVAHFEEALRITPDYAEAWNNLGVAGNRLGRFRRAADCFREALRVRPAYPEAWNNLGVSRHGLGEDRQALDAFREALRLKPEFPEALNNRGVSLHALGQEREAIACFREALRIRADSAEVLNNLGVSYGGLGDYGQAAACFRDALRIRPDYAEARDNLAAVEGALGRPR